VLRRIVRKGAKVLRGSFSSDLRPSDRPFDLDVVTAIHGRFLCFRNDLVTTQIKRYGAHTRNEIAFLLSVVRAGDSVVDCGAHIGTFAVRLAQKAGAAGRVLAIKADPLNYSLLQVNTHLNNISNRVRPLNVAIGREGETGSATREDDNNSGSTRFALGDGPTKFASLARIMAESGFTEPALVKIDIEGMDGIVLDDIAPILARSHPAIYFEVAQNWKAYGIEPREVGRELSGLGYRLFRNVGSRNSSNDNFHVLEFSEIADDSWGFDCLALDRESDRLVALKSRSAIARD
jgi:FkbM family methyltransferase